MLYHVICSYHKIKVIINKQNLKEINYLVLNLSLKVDREWASLILCFSSL